MSDRPKWMLTKSFLSELERRFGDGVAESTDALVNNAGLRAQIAVLEELSGGYDIRISEVKEKLAELRKELGE